MATEEMRELLMGRDSTVAQLSKLKRSMMVVKRVVDDAEKKQDADPGVKSWLNKVKHALYDAEDLIDEIHTVALQQRAESETRSNEGITQVFSRITANLGKIAHSLDPFYERVDSLIEKMNFEFKEFAEDIDILGLKARLEPRERLLSSRLSTLSRLPTTSLVDESTVYGRDSERDLIVKILQDGVENVHRQGALNKNKKVMAGNIPVVAIIGMPGIGKTTLAQLIFNDPRADDIFEFKAWICVPQVFDIFQIIISMLDLLPSPSHNRNSPYADEATKNLELLQKNLRERVAGKRLLIVLDDVRDEYLGASWEALRLSLRCAGPGSTVIVTTQNKDIAEVFTPIITLDLHELSDDDCWSLIKARALIGPLAASDETVEAIGRRIAAKCRGLPLAAKALGGLLSRTYGAKRWEEIENSRIWELPCGRIEILPTLLLSYDFLPPHLKRCFAYCSIFPKNYRFEKEKMVMLWMAEGFMELATDDIRGAEDYFDNLVARSFFQESISDKHRFVMHDLIHELAVYVMEEFGFMLGANGSRTVSGRPRHLSYELSQYVTAETFDPIVHADCLRTLFPVRSFSDKHCCYFSSNVLQSLERKFGRLRVLSLCGYQITSIPSSIGRLKHLRYLDLSSTLIRKVPDAVCSLFNLQTLLLSHCYHLVWLPRMIVNLTRMQHLDICNTPLLGMPEHIGRLSSLQTLTDFVVGKDQGEIIGELGELVHLKGCLRISGLDNVASEPDASAANLSAKKHIDELVLEEAISEEERSNLSAKKRPEESLLEEAISKAERSPAANKQSERVFQALEPHTNLRRLDIIGYGGDRFPAWVGDVAFYKLEVLHLRQCMNCIKLPPLGQLSSLKHLVIECFSRVETVGSEFYGDRCSSSVTSFKSLKSLKFIGLSVWKAWSTDQADVSPFPCLGELYMLDCPQLKQGFPLELPSLKVLHMERCSVFSGSLPRSPLLRELTLRDCVMADLANLAKLTRLTSLSYGARDILSRDQGAMVQAAMPLLASIDRLTLKGIPWSLRHPVPSAVRSLCLDLVFGIKLLDCHALQYLAIQNDSKLCDLCNLINSQFHPEGDDLVLTSLCDVSVERCLSMSSFPLGRFLADNLTTLSIHECSFLTSLLNTPPGYFQSLRFLSIKDCPLLKSFAEHGLPLHLQTLCIQWCQNLVSLPERMFMCTSLQLLDISLCPKLELFPANGISPNLHKLKISACKTFRCLPDDIHSTLMSLKLLHISKCPKMESLPQYGLPPNLEVLHVRDCEMLISKYGDWRLDRLVSLKELSIEGFIGKRPFPANGTLPSSLTILDVGRFPNFELVNCMELQRLRCLRELEIRGCSSLRAFSADLPPSLCRLAIRKCPLLLERCQGPAGLDVDKISHVTCILLDP